MPPFLFNPIMAAIVKQFGVGMLFSAVFAVALVRIYEDSERKNQVLVALVREQTEAARDVASNLRELISVLQKSD